MRINLPATPIVLAHDVSSRHRSALSRSELCGCFHCLAIYSPRDINRWICDGTTALCARCGIDSVIGSDSGYPIEPEFLKAMNAHWFASSDAVFTVTTIDGVSRRVRLLGYRFDELDAVPIDPEDVHVEGEFEIQRVGRLREELVIVHAGMRKRTDTYRAGTLVLIAEGGVVYLERAEHR